MVEGKRRGAITGQSRVPSINQERDDASTVGNVVAAKWFQEAVRAGSLNAAGKPGHAIRGHGKSATRDVATQTAGRDAGVSEWSASLVGGAVVMLAGLVLGAAAAASLLALGWPAVIASWPSSSPTNAISTTCHALFTPCHHKLFCPRDVRITILSVYPTTSTFFTH